MDNSELRLRQLLIDIVKNCRDGNTDIESAVTDLLLALGESRIMSLFGDVYRIHDAQFNDYYRDWEEYTVWVSRL